jgi:predicted phosphatase
MSNNCTPNVQKGIFDLYQNRGFQAQTGLIDAAFSAQNGAQVQAQMIQQNGLESKYSITYPSEVCNAVVDSSTIACSDVPVDTGAPTCESFDSFTGRSSIWFKTGVSRFRDLGSLTVQQNMFHAVYQQMQKLKAEADLIGITSLNTNAGEINSTTPTRLLKLVDYETGKPYPHSITMIENDFADAGYPTMPLLIGNRQINYLRNASNRGGVSDQGFNNANLLDIPAFYDININATNTAPTSGGNEVVFAIQPQIVNLLTWSENSGMFASRNGEIDWSNMDPMDLINTNNDSYMHTVLQDPATGMLFDFDLVYDPRCKLFTWKIDLKFKWLILNLTGCKFADFNGIIKYDICPWAEPSC